MNPLGSVGLFLPCAVMKPVNPRKAPATTDTVHLYSAHKDDNIHYYINFDVL